MDVLRTALDHAEAHLSDRGDRPVAAAADLDAMCVCPGQTASAGWAEPVERQTRHADTGVQLVNDRADADRSVAAILAEAASTARL